MEVDGNRIKQDIRRCMQERLAAFPRPLRLDLFYAGSNEVTEKFMQLKKDFGESVGVQVVMHTFAPSVDEDRILQSLNTVARSQVVDGVVVQLPLPDQLPKRAILDAVPITKDIDLLSQDAREQFRRNQSSVLPPVVGAIKEICDRHDIKLAKLKTAVVGRGRLVGGPVITWLTNNHAEPMVLEKGDDLSQLRKVDVVISGAGDPHIIKSQHVKDGVVLLDAGTSSTDQGTQGDVDPSCGSKAALLAPVPGGIGPVTIAKLFENLVTLSHKK